MKLVSWNINGLNNILHKSKNGEKHTSLLENNSLMKLVSDESPDMIFLQEVRCNHAVDLLRSKLQHVYPFIYVNCAVKKGYSGTAVLSKDEPLRVYEDMQEVHEGKFNDEGRILRVVFKDFCVINVYTPNSKPGLERLAYRYTEWEPAFRDVVSWHQKNSKCVIVCGDLNVAHQEIDLHNPRSNKTSAGFTDQERLSFGLLLHNNMMIDMFRYLRPTETKYTWWSNFHQSRDKNKGWRIDYFLINRGSVSKVVNCDILSDYRGSDHAPVVMDLA